MLIAQKKRLSYIYIYTHRKKLKKTPVPGPLGFTMESLAWRAQREFIPTRNPATTAH